MSLADSVRVRVRQRALEACEYCLLPESASVFSHHVDHIIAVQHGGTDLDDNLCLSCIRCNLKKGPSIASLDPESPTEQLVSLYNPRKERWGAHFELGEDASIRGLTATGRATVRLLSFNETERIRFRSVLLRRGWQPRGM